MKKRILVSALIVMLPGCGAQVVEKKEGEMRCPKPRPQICTMEYVPVCGRDQAGKLKTYANACTACANSRIEAYRKAACE